MKAKPVLYERNEECCGCAVCEASCPKGAIIMEKDEKGFLYPIIKGECILCNRCIKVCPLKN